MCREFRWIWQSTYSALLEIIVVVWIGRVVDLSLSVELQLLLVSLINNRVHDFLGKCYYVCTMIVTSMVGSFSFTYMFQYQKKLHFSRMYLVLVLQIIAFPMVLGVIFVASVLGAPLIPFLGLPIFLIGFPRPSRQTPVSGSSFA